MGCLEGLLWLFSDVLLYVAFPFFDPDPDEERNFQLYRVLAIIAGAVGVGWLVWQRTTIPADTGVPVVTWVSGGFCIYFALLSLVYWLRGR